MGRNSRLLELYNRPSLSNRVEAFTILMVNAWELLLKAELTRSSGYSAVFYKNSNRSLSLRDMLKRCMKENDPIRDNIEMLADIRDDAVHLLISRLQPEFSRLFQASVLNYSERYKHGNGNHPLAGQSVGLLSLIVDGPVPEIAQIKHEYGTETAERIKAFLERFRILERKHNASSQFAVAVEYKLVLTKKEKESDLVLPLGHEGQNAIILEKSRDINTTFPYREKEAVNAINAKLPNAMRVNQYGFRAIVFKHKIKENSQYHYKINVSGIHLYSDNLVNWVVGSLSKDAKWLDRATESYRHYLAKQRRS